MNKFVLFSIFVSIAALNPLLATGGIAKLPVPADFASVPWNASSADAKQTMRAANGAQPGAESAGELQLKGGRFGGLPVMEWTLRFVKELFTEGSVTFNVRGRATFDSVRAYYTRQFGEPALQTRLDGSVQCSWRFAPDPATGIGALVLCSYQAESRDPKYRATTCVTFKCQPDNAAAPPPTESETLEETPPSPEEEPADYFGTASGEAG